MSGFILIRIILGIVFFGNCNISWISGCALQKDRYLLFNRITVVSLSTCSSYKKQTNRQKKKKKKKKKKTRHNVQKEGA